MRYYYMDAMRSILMMLGVFIHSAQVFNPNQRWLVLSDNTHPFFNYVVTFIHSFRMPAFFIISGFFCLMMLQRQSVKQFSSNKVQRILVPLLTTVFTLNLLQSIFLSHVNNQSFSFEVFFTSGDWLAHLWFLINLLIYFFVAVSITYFFAGVIKKHRAIFNIIEKPPTALLLILLPFGSLAIVALNKIGIPLYSIFFTVLDVYQIVSYIPYFIFGMLLFHSHDLLKKFSTVHFASLLGLILVAYLLQFMLPFDSKVLTYFVNIYSKSLIAWVSSSIIFKLFYMYANKPSKTWLFLSNSAYSIYLFHSIIVVLLAVTLVKYNVAPALSFLILIVCTVAITLLIHKKIILHFKTIRFLFNGKY